VARRIADEAGGSVVTVQGDLWTADGMAELERVTFERFNRVDVLVNGLVNIWRRLARTSALTTLH
jgi:hypothetical protein